MKSPYEETADIETSSDDYATRFIGGVGEWFLEVQEKRLFSLFKEIPSGTQVLDIGGGHGQTANPLSNANYDVTVISSSEECKKRVGSRIKFQVGDLINLPFSDREFHTVISFRFISHCSKWRRLISEMCRVSSNEVIIEYPTIESVNILSDRFFNLKKKVEKNTRTFLLFTHKEISDEFSKNGFKLSKMEHQFILPMALHRALKCPSISRVMEGALRVIGLKRYGSPVIARFSRG